MARDFDGTNDNLLSADNAMTGMNVASKTICFWEVRDTDSPSPDAVIAGLPSNGGTRTWAVVNFAPAVAGYKMQFSQDWTTTDGTWRTTNDTTLNTRHFHAVTYNRGGAAPGNDPIFYVDGAVDASSEIGTPAGSVVTGDDTLKVGENSGGGDDLDGTLQHIAIYPSILSAGDLNRCMWWGRGQGGAVAYHPLVTTKLDDEGSAGETLTANGTTVAAFATPVVRPGTAMMGMGVGW